MKNQDGRRKWKVRKKMTNRHRCFSKIRKIFERTGILLSHDEITFLCEYCWSCNSANEFYEKMNALTDEQLKEEIQKMRKLMRKKKILQNYLETQAVIYS
jgi:predicted nucleic acid-binding Zn ribbon protein